MEEIVCKINNRKCILRYCEYCPDDLNIKEKVLLMLRKSNYEDDDNITFKQWVQTDRSEFIDMTLSFDEYIDKLILDLQKLKTHHFITKQQSCYIKNLKENIKEDEAIIVMDL